MSTNPEPAPDSNGPEPSREDPLVERLRTLHWPSVDEHRRERALEQFRELVKRREAEEGA